MKTYMVCYVTKTNGVRKVEIQAVDAQAAIDAAQAQDDQYELLAWCVQQ